MRILLTVSRDWGRDPEDHLPGYKNLYVFLGLLLFGGFALLWPGLAVHGRTPQGAWHWTTGTTVACSLWWGFLLVIITIVILGRANSPEVRAMEKAEHPWIPEAPQPDLRLMWVTEFLEP